MKERQSEKRIYGQTDEQADGRICKEVLGKDCVKLEVGVSAVWCVHKSKDTKYQHCFNQYWHTTLNWLSAWVYRFIVISHLKHR